MAIGFQNTTGNVAAQTALAGDIHRLARLDLMDALPQLIHRNIAESFHMACRVFLRSSGIQQDGTAVPWKMVKILQIPLLHSTICKVVDHESCHVHRILGGGVRRCIGQIQIFQLGSFHPCMDGSSQHIDPLVHTLVTHDLSAQQAVGLFLKDHLHGHQLPAGIVTRVAHGGEDHLVHIQTGLFRVGLVDAGGGRSHIKYLDDAASLRTQIAAVTTADIVSNDPPLLVGRTGQRDQSVLSGDIVLHLHRIACSVDIGHRGLHPVVDHNAALDAQFQPGFLRQCGVRRNADGQHYHIRMKGGVVLQQHIHAAFPFLKALHGITERQFHAVLANLCVDKRRHIRVKGVHQLLWALDDGDFHAKLPQVFRQFQTDKAATCQHNGLGMMCVYVLLDPEGILHSTERKQLV